VLRTLKRLVKEMFPADGSLDRRAPKVAERASKAVYIHSHMDEESFGRARGIMKCSVGVPEADGSNIPTCAYNVLYREQDASLRQSGRPERMLITVARPSANRSRSCPS
jgi:hypothetical protein